MILNSVSFLRLALLLCEKGGKDPQIQRESMCIIFLNPSSSEQISPANV